MMRKIFIGLGIATLIGLGIWRGQMVEDVQAVPVISGLTGQFIDGASVTITGSGFGTLTISDVEWIGGANGELEGKPLQMLMKNFDGTRPPCPPVSPPCLQLPPPGSTCMQDSTCPKDTWGEGISSTPNQPFITNERAHSYNKSIKCYENSNINGGFQSGFDYKAKHRFSQIYATWWTYFEPIAGSTTTNCLGPQWKVFRVDDGPEGERFQDTPGDWMLQESYNVANQVSCNPRGPKQRLINVYPNKASCNILCKNCPKTVPTPNGCATTTPCADCPGLGPLLDCYRVEGCCNCADPYTPTQPSGGAPNQSIAGDDGNRWVRWEVWAKESDFDVKNGTVRWWMTMGDGVPTRLIGDLSPEAGTPVCTRRDVTNDPSPNHNQQVLHWIWVCWHNYWGNSATAPVIANWYIDDPYISIMNGQARVELGDAATFATCTHREVQSPSAWADGSITVTANYGSFGPGPAYLYVVDAAGVASNGLAVTLPCSKAADPDRSGGTATVTMNDSVTTGAGLTHEVTSAAAAVGDTVTVSLKLTGAYNVTGFRAGIYFEEKDFVDFTQNIEPVAFHGNVLNGTRVVLTDPTTTGRCVDDGCARCPALEAAGTHLRGVKWVQWAGSAIDCTAGVEIGRLRFRAKQAGTWTVRWGCGVDTGPSEVQNYDLAQHRIYNTLGGGITAAGRGTFTETSVGDMTPLNTKFLDSAGTITVTGGVFDPCALWPLGPNADFPCSEFAVGIGSHIANTTQTVPIPLNLWGTNLTGGTLQLLYDSNITFVGIDSVRTGWKVTAVDTTITSSTCITESWFITPRKLKVQMCANPEVMTGARVCQLKFRALSVGSGFIWIDCNQAKAIDTETCVQGVDQNQQSATFKDGSWLTVGELGPWQGIPRLINIRHEAGYRRFFQVDPGSVVVEQ